MQDTETYAGNKNNQFLMHVSSKNARNSTYIVIMLTLNISTKFLWEMC